MYAEFMSIPDEEQDDLDDWDWEVDWDD